MIFSEAEYDKLRRKTMKLIRNKELKMYCEKCGSTDDLHLHHIKPFSIIVDEAFESIGLSREINMEITKEQFNKIEEYVKREHNEERVKFVTLCKECHNKEHKTVIKSQARLNKHLKYEETRKEMKIRANNKRVTLLNDYLNVPLNVKEYSNLIGKLKYNDNKMYNPYYANNKLKEIRIFFIRIYISIIMRCIYVI